jgi:metal-dependent amidase/aminoacylase/carboxypeptidase family protein
VKKGYEAINPNTALADTFARHLEELGWPIDPTPERLKMGSTDMGDISQVLPSIHPYLTIGRDLVGHSVEFREAAHSSQAFKAMITAAKAMALTAYDVLTKPDLFARVRADFRGDLASTAV